MTDQTNPPQSGTSRRDFLRRGAIVGGTLAWSAPALQTLARPAFADHGTVPPGTEYWKFSWTVAQAGGTTAQAYATADDESCHPATAHRADAVDGLGNSSAPEISITVASNRQSATVTVTDKTGFVCDFPAETGFGAGRHGTTSCAQTYTRASSNKQLTVAPGAAMDRVRVVVECRPT